MTALTDSPIYVFGLSLAILWLAAWIGAYFRKRRRQPVKDEERQDFSVIEGATLTLLGLIIGFSFSMAISRYDQRKDYEEAEANAIGTEYVRADLLPAADSAKVHALLRDYLDQRILFYKTRDATRLRQVNADTAQLQANLWSAVRGPVLSQPSMLSSLILSGMNDVLNSQGYTPSRLVESNSSCSLGSDGSHRCLLQSVDWIWFSPNRSKTYPVRRYTPCRVHFVLFDCRHRQPAWRRDSRGSAKSRKSC